MEWWWCNVWRDKEAELGKNTTIGAKDGGWYRGENNPDFKLALIHASNQGYQSKMRSDYGSYVISSFTRELKENIQNNKKPNKLFLYEILDKIQDDLHKKGKQLPIHTLNNGTRYIKFLKNDMSSTNISLGLPEKEGNLGLVNIKSDYGRKRWWC